MGELSVRDPRNISIGGFTLTSVGVRVEGNPELEEWRAAMQFVNRCASACMWWHGDMLNFGYASYGELASQEDGDGKYEYKTLREAKYVCDKVPLSIRMDKLSFGHHQLVAPLPAEEQEKWLRQAAEQEWPVSRLRKETADARADKELKERPLPKGRFNVIYADPPWRYDFSVSDSRKIENQYPTMEVEQICGIDVQSIAAPDCVLFLWATSPKLVEAMQVVEAWGFEYTTCMVWRKDKIGMGYYARQMHELLLIATRGSPPPPPEKSRPPSVVDGERAQHSRKPGVFYELIESMYPTSKRVELFCRTPRKGWKAWGNEVSE